MKESFRHALTTGSSFLIGAEIVKTRGMLPSSASLSALALELLSDKRITYISLTDNPGGNPKLPPDWLARQFAEFAPNIILHLSCKDFNRSGLESQLWRYAAEGFDNILALSGDLPTGGYPTLSSRVFDIDSVSLLDMMTAMNAGLPVLNRKGMPERLPPTNFFAGAVVNSFKSNENELIPQYGKLLKKIRAGASWIIPQLGFDMRKFFDVWEFLKHHRLSIPLIGNVFVLSKTIASVFYSGKLAGCVVTDSLMQQIVKYAAGADKGKQFFRELAAKQVAIFKGLGFSGVHIGGLEKAEAFFELIDLADSYSANDWQNFYTEIQYGKPNEFFFASSNASIIPERKKSFFDVSPFYRFSRLVHAVAFNRGRCLYPVMRWLYRFLDNSNPTGQKPVRRCATKMLHQIEYSSKFFLYSCSDCGDCGLPDTAYLCPMNRCSKNQRNGPCGGSNNGRCEADDKNCVWTIVYDRLKHFDEWEESVSAPSICYNAGLKGTSAWENLYLDRDHSAK